MPNYSYLYRSARCKTNVITDGICLYYCCVSVVLYAKKKRIHNVFTKQIRLRIVGYFKIETYRF